MSHRLNRALFTASLLILPTSLIRADVIVDQFTDGNFVSENWAANWVGIPSPAVLGKGLGIRTSTNLGTGFMNTSDKNGAIAALSGNNYYQYVPGAANGITPSTAPVASPERRMHTLTLNARRATGYNFVSSGEKYVRFTVFTVTDAAPTNATFGVSFVQNDGGGLTAPHLSTGPQFTTGIPAIPTINATPRTYVYDFRDTSLFSTDPVYQACFGGQPAITDWTNVAAIQFGWRRIGAPASAANMHGGFGVDDITFSANLPGITPSSLTPSVNESGAGNSVVVTYVLNAIPVDNVQLNLTLAGAPTQATLSTALGTSLLFTTANWNVPQNVTLTAVDDMAIEGNLSYNITGTITGNDLLYTGGIPNNLAAAVSIPTVSLTVLDDDPSQLVVTGSPLSVPEGSSANFAVRLSSDPGGTVNVSAAGGVGDSDLTSSSALSFDSGNYSVTQNIVVAAAEDADAANGSRAFTINASGAVTDSEPVTANEADNDTLSLQVTGSPLTVGEGSTNTYSAVLTAAPASTVTVTTSFVSGDGSLSVSGPALTFNSGNWSSPQNITIAAAEDADAADGSANFNVVATGGHSQTIGVIANEDDNDTLGLQVTGSPLTVGEGGSSNLQAVLTADPLGAVTVSGTFDTGDADLSVTSGSLNFNSGNWSTPQNVTISAAEDADAVDGSASFVVAATGALTQTVPATANENDNDTLGLSVTGSPITVPEGSTANLGAVLTADPLGTVTVTSSFVSGDADLSVTGPALNFNSGNWSVAQQIVVAAAEDADAADGTGGLNAVASGALTQTVPATANEDDNDTLGLSLTGSPVTVPEGGSNTISAVLTAAPLSTVTVISSFTSGDANLSVTGPALTFTSGNWFTAQNITIAAAEDADAVDGTGGLDAVASGGLVQTVPATANEDDNDTLSLSVTGSPVTVPEGSTANLGAVLTADPLGTVTVTSSFVSGDADLSVSGPALTFNSGNWSVTQQIVIAAAQDGDAVDGSGSLDAVASGALVQTSSGNVANEDDNDTLGLSLDQSGGPVPDPMNIGEGGNTSFDVQLSADPLGAVTVNVLRSSGDSDFTISSVRRDATLNFNSGNWSVGQAVQIDAAEDPDTLNGAAIVDVIATGALAASTQFTVQEVDNDSAGLYDWAILEN